MSVILTTTRRIALRTEPLNNLKMDAADTDAATPSFCMLELSVHGNDVVYAFLYNGIRFFVTIIHGEITPRTQIVDSLVNFLGSDCIDLEDVILLTTLPPVPVISAANLERVSDESLPKELSDISKKVRRAMTNEVFCFKGRFKDHGHLRELKILSQINCSSCSKQPLLTSRLAGLVVCDDEAPYLMGFLLEYIEGRRVLREQKLHQ